MAKIERDLYVKDINFLIENKIPHTIKYVGRSHKISSALGTYSYVNDVITRQGMGFIRKVGSYILRESTYDKVPKLDYNGLGLIRINVDGVIEPVYNEVVEVDLNKAYWVSAYRLGVINKEIYEQGIEMVRGQYKYNKIELLASIGTMAKTIKERRFDGEKYSPSKILVDSKKTKHIWDAVSYEVDKCMRDCMVSLREDFLFYWTDAVFFKKSARNIARVQKIINENGFESKIVDLEYISKVNGNIVAWSKKNHSKAKKAIRDEKGNYGRTFVYIHEKASITQDIQKHLEKYGKIDF